MVEQPFHPGHKADVKGVSGQPADAWCARYYLTVNLSAFFFNLETSQPCSERKRREAGAMMCHMNRSQ